MRPNPPLRQRQLLHAFVLILCAMVVASCVSRRGTTSAEPALLVFANESTEQAEILALVPAVAAIQLGIAIPGETLRLTLPPRVIRQGSINIAARNTMRGRQITSGPVFIKPGEVVQMTLPVGATQIIVETGRR